MAKFYRDFFKTRFLKIRILKTRSVYIGLFKQIGAARDPFLGGMPT